MTYIGAMTVEHSGIRWLVTAWQDKDQQPFAGDPVRGTGSAYYQGWCEGAWEYVHVNVRPAMTEAGEFDARGGPYEYGLVRLPGQEAEVQQDMSALVAQHLGDLVEESLRGMRATRARLAGLLAAADKAAEPWCDHIASGIQADGRCECGELVCCPDCAAEGSRTTLQEEPGGEFVRPGYAGVRVCPGGCGWRGIVLPVTSKASSEAALVLGRPYWTQAPVLAATGD